MSISESTGLLVSVRNLPEAVMVADAGVSIVDLKDPSNGPLGQVEPQVAVSVSQTIGTRATLSAAMGELCDSGPADFSFLRGYSFAKIGLSNMLGDKRLENRWHDWAAHVRQFCQPVVVVYADWKQCNAPTPDTLIRLATDARVPFLLFDTWHKDGRSLLDHLSFNQLTTFVQRCAGKSIGIALAGSLGWLEIRQLLQLPIDLIAVRGLVCRDGNRNKSIEAKRIRALLRELITDNKQSDGPSSGGSNADCESSNMGSAHRDAGYCKPKRLSTGKNAEQ